MIECQYQDSDISLDPTSGTSPVVLQFYNSAKPSTPWSGPNNSGASSNTFRDGVVAYQIKAGVAATTGSQTTPSPDTGWVGLWAVTVPYGATSLTSSNISQYTGSPILPSGIVQSIVTSNLTYGIDSGSAKTIPVTTLVDGMDVWVKVAAANTGATTFTPNPGVVSAAPVVGAAHAALQGGELVSSGRANLVCRADITSWVLVECTGAAIQVGAATQSQHAMQLGQATGRLLRVTRFSSSTTFTPGSGTTQVVVKIRGGGGSGSAAATGESQVSAGGPGSQGAYSATLITSGFSGQAMTIGSGGAGGTAGGAGSSGVSTTSAIAGAQGIATASGGSICNVNGGGGGLSVGVAATGAQFGIGGVGGGDTQPGAAGNIPGSDGGGLVQAFASSGAVSGLSGAGGYVEIWEYA